jgi:hypothetical protein
VGFFPASRLLKNAYKQFLRGAARPGLKPRVYIGFIAADFSVGAPDQNRDRRHSDPQKQIPHPAKNAGIPFDFAQGRRDDTRQGKQAPPRQ